MSDLRIDREEFRRIIDRDFTPLLVEQGFVGNRPHWRRLREPFVDCINLQSSKYGDQCCINLGVHLSFMPVFATGEFSKWTKLKEIDCSFRTRLSETPRWFTIWDLREDDQWWAYNEPGINAQDLIACFFKNSSRFFHLFSVFPDSLLSNLPCERSWNPGTYFVVAPVYLHLRDWNLAKKYSRTGLRHFGTAERFEEILTRAERAAQ